MTVATLGVAQCKYMGKVGMLHEWGGKTDFIADLTWWGLLRLALIMHLRVFKLAGLKNR